MPQCENIFHQQYRVRNLGRVNEMIRLIRPLEPWIDRWLQVVALKLLDSMLEAENRVRTGLLTYFWSSDRIAAILPSWQPHAILYTQTNFPHGVRLLADFD